MHYGKNFRCLNFGAKNAAPTKKRYARVYSIHEAIKVKNSGTFGWANGQMQSKLVRTTALQRLVNSNYEKKFHCGMKE